MAFDDILEKIKADGADAAAAVQAAADADVAQIRDEATRVADALRDKLHHRAQRRAAEHADRLRTLAKLDHRKAVLAEKQQALQEVFALAEQQLEALSPTDARRLLSRVIAERVETGNEQVVAGSAHADVINEAFASELNESLGDRGHLTLANTPGDFSHGVVLREGRKEINIRLPVLMAEARERLMHTIAERLFPADAVDHG